MSMAITLKLSAEQERLLREGTASADAVGMRRVLLEAIDSTIEQLLHLSARTESRSDFEASTERPTLKQLLLADSPRAEIPVPSRRRWRRRTSVAFE